jgi:ADP-ribosyl-[dinitrogen reductase] hydrolase
MNIRSRGLTRNHNGREGEYALQNVLHETGRKGRRMSTPPIPHPNCYWVVPGRFLAGQYPGDKYPAAARRKLGAILDAGVRCFVNLMEPDDTNWHGEPFAPYEDLADGIAAERGFTLVFHRFAIQDAGVPEPELMREVLDCIDRELAEARPVYVHCWGGHGRTGMVVGCYLIEKGRATPESFVDEIARLRAHVVTSIPSPETRAQRDFVRQFARKRAPEGPTEPDRYLGCLLGLATGDAVGTTLEFKPPGTFKPMDDMVGGGPFRLKPGEWTDDTSMALCLAESLIECGGFDPIDQLRRYRRWQTEGYFSAKGYCFDIGGTTQQALASFAKTGEPWSGPTSPRSAGNGSLMRLAPVPMAFARDPESALQHAADSSRTTHGAAEAVDACRYYAGVLIGALRGEPKEALLSSLYCPIPGYWEEHQLALKIHEIAAGSFKEKDPPEIRGGGYVVQALEAALWAFHKSTNFREGCLLAANLGDDADTTAAIYGQIAGAYYGVPGIPEVWRERIYLRSTIEAYAMRLYEMAGS